MPGRLYLGPQPAVWASLPHRRRQSACAEATRHAGPRRLWHRNPSGALESSSARSRPNFGAGGDDAEQIVEIMDNRREAPVRRSHHVAGPARPSGFGAHQEAGGLSLSQPRDETRDNDQGLGGAGGEQAGLAVGERRPDRCRCMALRRREQTLRRNSPERLDPLHESLECSVGANDPTLVVEDGDADQDPTIAP